MLTTQIDSDCQSTLSYYTSNDSVSDISLAHHTGQAIASNATIPNLPDGGSETVMSHHCSSDDQTLQPQFNKNTESNIKLTDQTNLLPFRRLVVVFIGLACCMVVTTLDSTIVATALPTISSYFQAGAISSWVPSATLLTSTAFQPLYGRFSE
jgi:hypothetical protein